MSWISAGKKVKHNAPTSVCIPTVFVSSSRIIAMKLFHCYSGRRCVPEMHINGARRIYVDGRFLMKDKNGALHRLLLTPS